MRAHELVSRAEYVMSAAHYSAHEEEVRLGAVWSIVTSPQLLDIRQAGELSGCSAASAAYADTWDLPVAGTSANRILLTQYRKI